MFLRNVHLSKKEAALKGTYAVENCSSVHKHLLSFLQGAHLHSFAVGFVIPLPPVSSPEWSYVLPVDASRDGTWPDLFCFSSATGT